MTRRSLVCVLFVLTLVTRASYADTFEFLNYTPPTGWTRTQTSDGTTFVRPNGIGLVYFYNGYATTGSAADEFAKMWRTRLEPTVPGPAPQPQLQREGDFTVAAGSKQIDAKGTLTTVALASFVARGRAIGVLTMAAGDDALREITAFLNSLDVAKGTTASTGEIDVDFQVPPGYTSSRDGSLVILKPTTVDRNTPCVYGLSSARASRGSLEADAQAAILEPLAGWQISGNHFNAMRGVSGAGWQYYWLRTEVRQLVGSSYKNLTAMATAFQSSPGRVNILWGFGELGPCMTDDATFLRIFFSLRPRGWTSDGGKALAGELVGTWRDTQAQGMVQYKFASSGRYARGVGTSTTFGNLETRTGSVGDGRFALRESDLTITPDARGSSASTFKVRIYDEFAGGRWTRSMSLLNESSKPPQEIQYMRVDD